MKIAKKILRFPFVLRARARDVALRRRHPHELAVAAIFREEAPFLQEWLTFHTGVGVTHFYLYNNFSTDHFRDVLAPWIASGAVTLHEWQIETGQLPAFRHCVRTYADAARWIAFIDIDEFLFSPEQRDIRPILSEYHDLPGVIVHSPYFGSAGQQRRLAGPIVDVYVQRAPLTLTSAKTIANPRWVYTIRNVHAFKYWAGEALDSARRSLKPGLPPVLDRLRLNHYWSRSIEDLEIKVRRGDASTADPRKLDWHMAFERQMNAELDGSIVLLAREIRLEEARTRRGG